MADTEEAHAAASTSITSITPTDKDATKSKLPQSSLHCENFMCLLFLVCVLLNATGNVPIIKKRTWTVDPNKTVSWIQKFIHKYLKLDATEQIVGSPSPILNPDLISYFPCSFYMLTKHLHLRRIRSSRTYTIATAPMANWCCTIARIRRGAKRYVLG